MVGGVSMQLTCDSETIFLDGLLTDNNYLVFGNRTDLMLTSYLIDRSDYEPWHMQHYIGVRSKTKQVKLDWATKKMDVVGAGKESQDVSQNVHDKNLAVADVIYPESILDGSSHRDGAIYKENWKSCYDMDMADRNETVSDLKKLTETFDCYPDQENCITHAPSGMMQIFSLRLAKAPINSGLVLLYGYMAARDDMDGLLNYVFDRSRDDPIIMQQGSLMEMTGPKRGIVLLSDVVFEFDMRIKTGENEEDDMQLIDGLIHYEDHIKYNTPFTIRISGNHGAVDMSFAAVECGVEAVIEVVLSEVQSDFDLSLSSVVCLEDLPKEVQLFYGAAREMGIKRSVVAVPLDTTMHLKFKICQEGSDSDAVHYCSLDARLHGCTNRQIPLGMACISLKVTWRPPLF
ncbi:hypothetical protein PR202_ga11038 [Eleusine coracana subsp. coracana]|uniref:DUF6598 domain-containing protein n=1 Tax=Eleusine coracana subsp. coracana TaxID=191504 RepID=A0AAV5C819_ELECO|nr:hypothetical protein PR202_ga11038 [Eleusine coracana subsp. coracana]